MIVVVIINSSTIYGMKLLVGWHVLLDIDRHISFLRWSRLIGVSLTSLGLAAWVLLPARGLDRWWRIIISCQVVISFFHPRWTVFKHWHDTSSSSVCGGTHPCRKLRSWSLVGPAILGVKHDEIILESQSASDWSERGPEELRIFGAAHL